MEIYNGIVCISGTKIIRSENNPDGFMTMNNYRYYTRSNRVNILRRGGGEGNPSLIEFASLPKKYRDKVRAIYGDPKVESQKKGLAEHIERKEEAIQFYKNHRIEYIDRIESLPDNTQELYVNNAAVLDALAIVWDAHVVAIRGKGKRPLSGEFWRNASKACKRLTADKIIEHDLPKSAPRLREKLEAYKLEGYDSLISKKFANINSVKITEEAGNWLVARYSSMIEIVTIAQLFAEYNLIADDRGWEKLLSSESIYLYLHRPEIEPRWHAARYGELLFKEKYTRQHRTVLASRRDTLWYSDGTKLNYYYQDKAGKTRTCNVYEVMDVYSEVFLGCHISDTEDYEAQYYAFKMAIGKAGHKPYELRYDNQGGHRKLEGSQLLKNLAKHAITTAPYNGKSKTIESAFGRFQAQFLHKDWFFTGQNITAVKKESTANIERILANTANLPSLDEIKLCYAQRRDEWNNAAHPKTGISRMEMYNTSVNKETHAVDWLDMISIFGITTKKPATYRAGGLEIQVKGKEYAYEVLTASDMPDMDFYRRNIGRKFHTRYCPDDMSIVSLYEQDAQGNMRFVTMAQSFIHVNRAKQDQTSFDHRFIRKMDAINKQVRIDSQLEQNRLLEKHGMHPNQHGLNISPIKGVNTSKAKKGTIDIGELQKEKSNMDALLEKQKQIKRTKNKEEVALVDERENERINFYKMRRNLLYEDN